MEPTGLRVRSTLGARGIGCGDEDDRIQRGGADRLRFRTREDSVLVLSGAEHDRLCLDRGALTTHRGGEQEIPVFAQKELSTGLCATFVIVHSRSAAALR